MLKLKLQYLATWYEELTHWKRPWFWERLRAGGEGDDRGWDGWMASPTRWAWVWVNSGSWWWTGRPGVLWFMGSQRVMDWTEQLNWTCGSADKESSCNAGDLGLIPGLERSPREGNGYPVQYSGLENSMDCRVHGVTESDMTEWLSLSPCSVELTVLKVAELKDIPPLKINLIPFEFLTIFHP